MNTNSSMKTVFVSGGTSGLGLQAVEYFARNGFSVIFCSRNLAAVDKTVTHLRSLTQEHQQIIGFENDISNEVTTFEMFEKVRHLKLSIDILLCNAGVIGPIDKFLDCNVQDWQNAFGINVYGTTNLIKEVLPSMLSKKWGRVIHISGGGATKPLHGMTSYSASKAAAVRLIETLAIEYKDSGVTFNSIAPGMVKSQLLDQMINAGPDRVGEELFARSSKKAKETVSYPESAISLISFVSGEESAGITGKLISAEWDNWQEWPKHVDKLLDSDLYTIRRIVGKDRGEIWGDV